MRSISCSIIFLLSAVISIYGLETRIFQGSNAEEGEYPYHAYLSTTKHIQSTVSHTICGGSIINKRWILTAAHCFQKDDFRNIQVKVGSVIRSSGTIYQVEKRIVHEGFDRIKFENDIALLRVEKDIEFTETVQPITLANKDTIIRDGETVAFTGFGRIEDFTRPERLKTAALKLYGYRKCHALQPHIVETHICTLSTHGTGPCKGDSGGPLVNRNGVQVGIDSHSCRKTEMSCGEVPEIYTQVSSFRDWIDKIIRDN